MCFSILVYESLGVSGHVHMNLITLKPHTQYLPQEEFGVVYLVWIHQSTRIGYCDQ